MCGAAINFAQSSGSQGSALSASDQTRDKASSNLLVNKHEVCFASSRTHTPGNQILLHAVSRHLKATMLRGQSRTTDQIPAPPLPSQRETRTYFALQAMADADGGGASARECLTAGVRVGARGPARRTSAGHQSAMLALSMQRPRSQCHRANGSGRSRRELS